MKKSPIVIAKQHFKGEKMSQRSEEEKSKLIEKYKVSDQTMKAWCKDQSIPKSTFYQWWKKAIEESIPPANKFIKLEASQKNTASSKIELSISGVKLTITTTETKL